MRQRRTAREPFAASIAIAIVSLCATQAAPSREQAAAAGVPLMADGKPDLQGIWTGGTLTPFERPAQLTDTAFHPASDLEARNREASQAFWASGHVAGEVGRDNDAFLDQAIAILPNGQTSLVVEPRDGKIPMLPEAERQRDFNLSNFDSFESMSQWDRCITREPTALLPVVYNNAYQIVQTSTHVVIHAEMVHDARIIPLDGRPHVDKRVTGWGGDSRAHWEGKTLVVDTTNFNDRGWIATGQNARRLRGVPYDAKLHIVERFTRVDAQTLNYEITIEDPTFYSAPWKMSYPLKRDDSYRMFEYACHEGNSAVQSILGGARAQERAER
jgi:hypothetical protein